MRSAAVFANYVHEELRLRMSAPVEVAACNNDKLAYSLYRWVDGYDADEVIKKLHTPLQFRFGEEAGKMLRKIHSVKSPTDSVDLFPRNIMSTVERFEACGVRFAGDKDTIDFIKKNIGLTENRPICAIHGDYTTANLVFDKSGGLGIIDFSKWDWGDPMRDFARVRFSCSKAFVKGEINGYFGGDIPPDFFRLMALYTAADIISEITSAYPFSMEKVDKALNDAVAAARMYSGYKGLIPDWYL